MVERTAMPKASPRLANTTYIRQSAAASHGALASALPYISATTPTSTAPATSALRNAATILPAATDAAGRGESTSSFAVAFSHSLVIESCPNRSPASIAPNTSVLTNRAVRRSSGTASKAASSLALFCASVASSPA